ncbi:MAG: metalloregulator ArsR/SmtB family transcription factor [Methylococcaceae bacterium]
MTKPIKRGIIIAYLRYNNMTHDNKSIPEACCTLDVSGFDQKRLLAMFKALGNPVRFEIMKFLVTHPGSITGEIVDYLPIAQATTSQHLAVLREAGWIEGIVEGPAVNYHLNEEAILWFRSKINHIF